MHILLISHGYPSKQDPQWGCFEKDQAEALIALGHTVSIAVLDTRFRQFKRKRGINHFIEGGISVYIGYWLPLAFISSKKMMFLLRRKMMSKVCNAIFKREERPDIIYAHYLFGIFEASSVAKKNSIPLLGIEHWSLLNSSNLSSSIVKIARSAYSSADKLLVVSPSLQYRIKKELNIESEVLPDMVNDLFLNTPLPQKQERKHFRFVSVGTLNRNKSFDILIKSFSDIDDKDAELFIIGEGPERKALKELINELNLEARIHLCGMKTKEEIINYYLQSDAFVLSSKSETFGVAYIEALAMGLPVIATFCGGPESFVNEDCGLLVPVDSLTELTKAMNTVEYRINEYDPQQLRDYVRSLFSEQVIAKRLQAIMHNMIEKK